MAKHIRDMTEPEIRDYCNLLMSATTSILPGGIKGCLIVMIDDDNISQFVSSIDRSDSPSVLRELADRIESRNYVERN